MFSKRISQSELENDLASVTDWDDWERLRRRWFETDHWPNRSLKQMDHDLNREPKRIRGRTWEPCSSPYDVDPDLEFLYEKSRMSVFAALEPDAERENKTHPEWYGWRCVYCRIYTVKKTLKCGICHKELVPLPLNE